MGHLSLKRPFLVNWGALSFFRRSFPFVFFPTQPSSRAPHSSLRAWSFHRTLPPQTMSHPRSQVQWVTKAEIQRRTAEADGSQCQATNNDKTSSTSSTCSAVTALTKTISKKTKKSNEPKAANTTNYLENVGSASKTKTKTKTKKPEEGEGAFATKGVAKGKDAEAACFLCSKGLAGKGRATYCPRCGQGFHAVCRMDKGNRCPKCKKRPVMF